MLFNIGCVKLILVFKQEIERRGRVSNSILVEQHIEEGWGGGCRKVESFYIDMTHMELYIS